MKRYVVFLLAVFLCGFVSASLGIVPAKKDFNFEPGQKIQIPYTIITDNPDNQIELYVEGDLSDYVHLSKTHITGGEDFIVSINLPQKLDKPGTHTLIVGAREVPPENQFLGVAINIRSVVHVFVPYPGRYADVYLNIPDANAEDQLPIEVRVVNQGTENLSTDVFVNFFDDSKNLLSTLSFTPVNIGHGEDRYFRKYLNTSRFKPGTYYAEAHINYGTEIVVNKTFRLGSLFVNVTNVTESLHKNGLQKFYINLESKWNNPLSEVYADVNLSNQTGSLSFRTPSTSLSPWSSGQLVGFVDTDLLSGEYLSEVIVSYNGQNTTYADRLVITEKNYTAVIVLAIVLIVLLLLLALWYFRKRKKKK